MFGNFMPREGKFFDFFNAHAEQIVTGAEILVLLLKETSNGADVIRQHTESIDAHERQADRITHDTFSLLHSTFITPFDRDQIHKLIGGMDDVLDLIQDVAESVSLYDINSVPKEAQDLAALSLSCCQCIQQAVGMLKDLDNASKILQLCSKIDALESDADRVLRSAMSALFRSEPDVRQVIKLRTIYELLETITDRCEDVANVIESIILENS